MVRKEKTISLILALFVLSVVLMSVGRYYVEFRHQRGLIDSRLMSAAIATNFILGERLHSGLIRPTLSKEREKILALKLTQLIQSLDLAYAYSVVERDGVIRFVVSSAEPGEFVERDYTSVHWSTYPEADEALREAFKTQRVQYAEYQDRWGVFRSVFLPRYSEQGELYVIGADINISFIDQVVRNVALHTLIVACIVVLCFAPFVWLAIRSLRAKWQIEEHALYVDELTQLPTKAALQRDLKQCDNPTLILINIDRFRYLNTSYGLAFGDQVLREFALNVLSFQHQKLQEFRLYRLYSDEFAVLAEQRFDETSQAEIFEAFFRYLAQCVYHAPDDKHFSLGVHLGVAAHQEEPLALAEMALRNAKEVNRSVVYFTEATHLPKAYTEDLHRTERIKRAFAEQRIRPFWQPIVNVKNHQIEKYEALGRIVTAQGEVEMTPDEFIPLMIKARLYPQFTRLMLEKSLEAIKQHGVVISINFSTRDFMDRGDVARILSLIEKSQVGNKLHIELLETDGATEPAWLRSVIKRLRALGCQVGIDDLGRAYSNFDRLTSLPIDFIKIDRSVMPRIMNEESLYLLVQRILLFAKQKQMTTIVEHCDSLELCLFAQSLGVDFLQGFYLGEPTADLSRVLKNEF